MSNGFEAEWLFSLLGIASFISSSFISSSPVHRSVPNKLEIYQNSVSANQSHPTISFCHLSALFAQSSPNFFCSGRLFVAGIVKQQADQLRDGPFQRPSPLHALR